MNDSKPIRIGGLWANTTKEGKKYLSGNFGMAKLLVFPNDRKQKDTDPDYTILIAEKPQQQNGAPKVEDDIPF